MKQHKILFISECHAMMVDDGKCHYCGEPDPDRITGLDRMDSQGHYIVGNVCPCCATCNRIKRNLDAKTFIERCVQISGGVTVAEAWPEVQQSLTYAQYQARARKKRLIFEIPILP